MDDGCVICGQVAVRIIDAEDGPEARSVPVRACNAVSVLCGEATEWIIAGDDGRRFPVCYLHTFPADYIQWQMAIRDLPGAVWQEVSEHFAQVLSYLLEEMKRRWPRRIESVRSRNEDGESDG